MKIGNIKIGDNYPVFVIAELSANHNQSYDLAVKTIEAAKEAGADAIKLQTYTPDTITINCDNDYFKLKSGLWAGQTLYNLYEKAYTPWEWHPKLKAVADKLGLILFSTPFDNSSVDFLESINVPAYKIAGFEIEDLPLIKYVASKKKPIIISTGIAELSDIDNAVKACLSVGNDQIALLKCTSSYPAPLEIQNLLTIRNMRKTFDCVVGLSDHTLGSTAPITAVALGAKIIEKHFIIDRSTGGPDSEFSMEFSDFKTMVTSIREVEACLGKVSYELTDSLKEAKKYGRSLFIVADIEVGEEFTRENIRSIRPGHGISPSYIEQVLGKQATVSIKKGTPLEFKHVKF
ncbi:MAG: pseudaminic acid synthase [Bacteroidetes bacterium GWE2_29_8]|nr:MAG: pseudaminic acid synthase [Bacteroidetes bacterium GWE2_29_8]OFY17175.1 MAG: pseudaminic acid synthase [Bacteroidetes bacterium GWF2_29_10]